MAPSESHEQVCCIKLLVPSEDDKAEMHGKVEKGCSAFRKVVLFLSRILTACLAITASFAAMPVLLLSLITTRLFQLFRRGHNYEKATHLKIFITTCMYMDVTLLVSRYIILGSIAYSVPRVRHAKLLGMPIFEWFLMTNWIYVGGAWTHFIGTLFTKFVLPQIIPLTHNENGLNIEEAVTEIICAIVLWMLGSSIRRIIEPTFLQDNVLGLHLWTWIKVLIFLLIGFDIIRISTHLMVHWLRQCCKNLTNPESEFYKLLDKLLYRKYLTYCANGLRRNISFIMTTLMFLLTWVIYFGSHLSNTHNAKVILDFGNRTFVTLLISSFFWLVKKCILLSWEVYDVFGRLNTKIIETRKLLYFLGILGRRKHDIFDICYKPDLEKSKEKPTTNQNNVLERDTNTKTTKDPMLCRILGLIIRGWVRLVLNMTYVEYTYRSNKDDEDEWEKTQAAPVLWKLSRKKLSKVRNSMFMPKEHLRSKGWTPDLHDIHLVARYFLSTKNALSRQEYVSEVVNDMESNINEDCDSSIDVNTKKSTNVDVNKLKKLINCDPSSNKDDGDKFIDILKEFINQNRNAGDEEITVISLENLKKWMETAQNKCLFLANTLSSSKELVDGLNRIMSFIIVVGTFIMWLLLTGLATFSVLVLITSPILAATFIFGDTCKTMFQGIIFVYVLHPFHVGDTCEVEPDKDELVVKAIGVWKTIFLDRKTHREVIYPNAVLAAKKIINHKFKDFHWLGKKGEKDGEVDSGAGGDQNEKETTTTTTTQPEMGAATMVQIAY